MPPRANSNYIPKVFTPPNTVYTSIPVYVDDDTMKQVIGKDGYYFKAITRHARVGYIWFDKNYRTILIYAKEGVYNPEEIQYCFQDAMMRINQRFWKVYNDNQIRQQEQMMDLD